MVSATPLLNTLLRVTLFDQSIVLSHLNFYVSRHGGDSRVAGQGDRSSLIFHEDRYLLPLYKDEQDEHCHTKQSEAGFMKLA